ncbi:MAG: TolC family protein [Gemmataceae bacterium]|nr:TolC family protein [Gemmataceae bacterium]MCI0740094.1 TolC family protein [Gemmataceae bacterium]
MGIAKAQFTLRREQAQAVPNVTLAAGYQRNFNEREHQATYQVGVPLPLFNRNQGNIRAARAELSRSELEVARAQNALQSRLAAAFGLYEAAQARVERLTNLRKQTDLYIELTLKLIGAAVLKETDQLQLIQAQRLGIDLELEYVRAWGELWRARSEIAGLALLDQWPPPLGPPKK